MKGLRGWGAAAAAAMVMAGPLTGQQVRQQQVNRQQQMEMQQQRMRQLDQMAQRMERVQEQVRNMNRVLQEEMDRLRAQNVERNQNRIQQTQRIRDMGESMGLMAQQMQRTMLQLREMEGDPNTLGDAEMLRHMEQLRERLQAMCDGMEEGLQIMEQLHKRVREGGGPGR